MTTRGNVGGALLTIAMTAALWAWSGGAASAQTPNACGCTGETCPPCPIVTCESPEALACDSGETENECSCPTAVYQPGTNVAKVFKFGNNNSIQVKFDQVGPCPVDVTVELIPTDPGEDFQSRVTSEANGGVCPITTNLPYPPTPEIECNVTVASEDPDLVDKCAVYRVSFTPREGCYTAGPKVVGYTIGWLDPDVKKNKHDYMLLRDPDSADGGDDGSQCFNQDITDKLLRNYNVGTIVDPGLGGRTCCPSEYVVARQRVRPAR